MAPIVKENEVLTAASSGVRMNASATSPPDAAAKTQAVALELPVSVNGARTVEGSDKREPFSEATKTVLVFGNGAVIRLQSPVAAGQLLFLTNEQTKKEVVCQVVKSKNYRSVSGYVELEFTEPVMGFWGMRFPTDRLGNKASAAGNPSVAPVPPPTKHATPVPAKPDATANFNALKAMISGPEPQKTDLGAMSSAEVVQKSTNSTVVPSVPVVPPQPPSSTAPPSGEASTESLKMQANRLQQQLSSMLFSEKENSNSTGESTTERNASKAARSELRETTAKVIEFTKTETSHTPVVSKTSVEALTPKASVPPGKSASGSTSSLSDAEEVKIPSWLEPLARNAAAASAAEASIAKEEPKHKEEPILASPIFAESLADSAPAKAEADVTPFNTMLLESEDPVAPTPARSSNKGILIGALAAAVLLAAAGYTWYARNQDGGAHASPSPAMAPGMSQVPVQSSLQANVGGASPVATAPSMPASPISVSSGGSNGGNSAGANLNNAVAKTAQPAAAVQVPAQVPVQPPKKSSLGEVRLAAPNVSAKGGKSLGGAEEPSLTLGGADSVLSTALSGIATTSKQPVAPSEPLPVGGDVKPAKLINSVSPIYPQLAKTQHVSGDVRVDALIDANGRVTTMKVVAGPTLLHQAAMDALHQWRYQPATLDGKPVPMHLTVTLQFRLQ